MKPKVKQILLFLFLLLASNVFSNIDSLKKVLQTKDFKEVKRYLHDFRKTQNNYGAFTFSKNFNDTYFAISFQLQIFESSDSFQNSKTHLYSVNLFSKQLEIFYYQISDLGSNKINKEYTENKVIKQIDYLDTVAFKIFEQKNNLKYNNISKNINSIFPESYIYGDGCGYTGKNPNPRLWLEDYILEKDSNALFSWLISPHLGLRVYAIEGFYQLEKNGMGISHLQWQTIQNIKTSMAVVETCGGCIYSQETIIELCKRYKFKKRKKQKKKVN